LSASLNAPSERVKYASVRTGLAVSESIFGFTLYDERKTQIILFSKMAPQNENLKQK
jgi:hypothetical protein